MLIAMIAHKIVSFLVMIILIVGLYIAFANPQLISSLVTKYKTFTGTIDKINNVDLNNINMDNINLDSINLDNINIKSLEKLK